MSFDGKNLKGCFITVKINHVKRSFFFLSIFRAFFCSSSNVEWRKRFLGPDLRIRWKEKKNKKKKIVYIMFHFHDLKYIDSGKEKSCMVIIVFLLLSCLSVIPSSENCSLL